MDRFYAATCDEGPYYLGPFDSVEEAIEEAKDEYQDEFREGSNLYIGIARPVSLTIDGNWIIENIAESHHDDLYEDALDMWCSKISKDKTMELGTRLTKVLHEWLKENKEKHTFVCIDPFKEIEGTKLIDQSGGY